MLLRLSGMAGHKQVQADVVSPLLPAPDTGQDLRIYSPATSSATAAAADTDRR